MGRRHGFPHTNDELEKAVMEHLAALKEKLVSDTELQKVKNNVEARYIRSMESNMGLAMTLLRYQLIRGDWRLLLKMREMVNSVTAADIRDCARKYFVSDNATVAQLIKRPKPAGARSGVAE